MATGGDVVLRRGETRVEIGGKEVRPKGRSRDSPEYVGLCGHVTYGVLNREGELEMARELRAMIWRGALTSLAWSALLVGGIRADTKQVDLSASEAAKQWFFYNEAFGGGGWTPPHNHGRY